MEIKIEDYLSKDEIKQIVREEVKDIVRHKIRDKGEVERIIVNSMYSAVGSQLLELISQDENILNVTKSKLREVLNSGNFIATHTLFDYRLEHDNIRRCYYPEADKRVKTLINYISEYLAEHKEEIQQKASEVINRKVEQMVEDYENLDNYEFIHIVLEAIKKGLK